MAKSTGVSKPQYNAQDQVSSKSEPTKNSSAGSGQFGSEPKAIDLATHYVSVKGAPKSKC